MSSCVWCARCRPRVSAMARVRWRWKPSCCVPSRTSDGRAGSTGRSKSGRQMTRARRPRATRRTGPWSNSFLDMMSAERGASPNTLAAYRRDILDFAANCARSRTSLKEAARNNVAFILASLAAAGLKASSQARKLSALRRFYAFLYAEGIRRDDPCGAVDAPRLSRPCRKSSPRTKRSSSSKQRAAKRPMTARRARGCSASSRCCTPPACASVNW